MNIGKLRASKYIYHLVVLARTAHKSLKQPEKQDIESIIGRINTSVYSDAKARLQVVLKKYFQWLRGCDENEHVYPAEVRWIKTTNKRKRLLPEALLTAEELRRMVEARALPSTIFGLKRLFKCRNTNTVRLSGP